MNPSVVTAGGEKTDMSADENMSDWRLKKLHDTKICLLSEQLSCQEEDGWSQGLRVSETKVSVAWRDRVCVCVCYTLSWPTCSPPPRLSTSSFPDSGRGCGLLGHSWWTGRPTVSLVWSWWQNNSSFGFISRKSCKDDRNLELPTSS